MRKSQFIIIALLLSIGGEMHRVASKGTITDLKRTSDTFRITIRTS